VEKRLTEVMSGVSRGIGVLDGGGDCQTAVLGVNAGTLWHSYSLP